MPTPAGLPATGTVFEITPSGKLTTLHSFAAPAGFPVAGLLQSTSGIFYGTTELGGDLTCNAPIVL